MLSLHSCLLLSFASLIAPAVGTTCQPRAISLPYKNIRLATSAEARGVLWQIGSPAQSVALAPSAYYNDTYLWGGPGTDRSGGWCPGSMSASQCATYRGGLYDRTLSTTDSDVGNLRPNAFDGTTANWTKDDITLSDNTTLPKYQFAINTGSTNEFVHKGELGLGRESAFLKTLGEQQKISSRSYSFFWGNEVTKEPREGSLTLGGYDQALIDGKNVTATPQKYEDKCREGLIVNLTSLGLQIDGTTKDAWEGLADLKVCIIATTNNIMSIPEAYWAPIETLMGVKRVSTRNGTSDQHFYNTTIIDPASATYTGSMAITINNELTVTIPNDQLIFNERTIARNGIIESRENVKQIPIVRIPPTNGMMPRLGGMFFSSAVLVVNHDKSQFSIAQAATKTAPQKIMAMDTTNECVDEVKAATASGTPGSNSGNNGGSSGGSIGPPGSGAGVTGDSSSGLSGGTIAGIVVGVVAGIALVAGIAFILWRRRRQHAPINTAEMEAYPNGPPLEKYRHDAVEVHGDGGHELNAYSDHSHNTYELDGAWRPSEVSGQATGSATSRDGLTR